MVSFPQQIAISNPRLNLVFWMLMLAFAAGNIALIVVTSAYLYPLPVATRLYVKPAKNQDRASSALQLHEDDSICTSVRCLPRDTHIDATYYAESASQMFVLSTWSEQSLAEPVSQGFSDLKGPSSGPNVGDEHDDNLSYVPSADFFALVFEYDMKMLETFSDPFSKLLPQPQRHGGFRTNHSLTVIVDSEHQPWRTLQPGEPVQLTSSEILFLSMGASDGLTDEPPSSTSLPTRMRTDGAEVSGRVDCFGSEGDLTHYLQPGVTLSVEPTLAQPVCMLRFDLAAIGASSKQILPGKSGSRTMSLSRGLRVQCEHGAGAFSVVSSLQLLLMFTNTMVILTIPRRLLLLFACHCLGHLSTIYRHAIFAPFDLRDEVAAVAARLAANSAAFVQLADTELSTANQLLAEDDPNLDADCRSGMSRNRLRERLYDILQFRCSELNHQEVEHLTSFAFDRMLNADKNASTAKDMAKLVKMDLQTAVHFNHTKSGQSSGSCSTDADQLSLDIDSFSCACSTNEHLGFDAWVKLFDADRPRYYMERLFTPHVLWVHIERARANNAKQITREDRLANVTSLELEKKAQKKHLTAVSENSKLLTELHDKFCQHQSQVSDVHATFSENLAQQQKQLEHWFDARLEEFRTVAGEQAEIVRAELIELRAPADTLQLASASPPGRASPEVLEALARRLETLAVCSPSLARLNLLESRVAALEHRLDMRHHGVSPSDLFGRSDASNVSTHLGSSLLPLQEIFVPGSARGPPGASASTLHHPHSSSWEAQLQAFHATVTKGMRSN